MSLFQFLYLVLVNDIFWKTKNCVKCVILILRLFNFAKNPILCLKYQILSKYCQ